MDRPLKREAMLSLYEVPLYDAAAVRELFMAVGRPDNDADKVEAVAISLSEICKSFALDLFHEGQATTPARERGARALAKACAKVLELAGVKDGGELLPMFAQEGLVAAANLRGEPRGEAATMNALHAVDLLRLDALKMLEIEGKRRAMKGPKAGRPEVKALRRLVRDLSCLYENAWGLAPGFCIGTNAKAQPSGPFMRLLQDVLDRLAGRGVQVTSSAESLRAIWRRIDEAEKMPTTHLLEQAQGRKPTGTPPIDQNQLRLAKLEGPPDRPNA